MKFPCLCLILRPTVAIQCFIGHIFCIIRFQNYSMMGIGWIACVDNGNFLISEHVGMPYVMEWCIYFCELHVTYEVWTRTHVRTWETILKILGHGHSGIRNFFILYIFIYYVYEIKFRIHIYGMHWCICGCIFIFSICSLIIFIFYLISFLKLYTKKRL